MSCPGLQFMETTKPRKGHQSKSSKNNNIISWSNSQRNMYSKAVSNWSLIVEWWTQACPGMQNQKRVQVGLTLGKKRDQYTYILNNSIFQKINNEFSGSTYYKWNIHSQKNKVMGQTQKSSIYNSKFA